MGLRRRKSRRQIETRFGRRAQAADNVQRKKSCKIRGSYSCFHQNVQIYNIIEKTYEGMNLLNAIQNVHLRIEELKFQKELYDKIIKLSYVYCCNNGIEYP